MSSSTKFATISSSDFNVTLAGFSVPDAPPLQWLNSQPSSGVADRVTQLEEASDFERQGEVIALMMYLGDPPQLNEHLLVKSKSKCLEMKQIAEETSFAYYECAIVDANLKGGKITSINEELEVLQ